MMPEQSEAVAIFMHLVIKCGERIVAVAPGDLDLETQHTSTAVLLAKCPACGNTHRFCAWDLR